MTLFITDGEGPVTKNDNAFEVTAHYIKGPGVDGGRFYSVVSSYDDVLAYVLKRRGYKAGDTLRLILPFLKAFGATDKGLERYSQETLLLMPGAKDTLADIQKKLQVPTYIISTSYESYVKALCRIIEFPFNHAYCTRLTIDEYDIINTEAKNLKKICAEISSMNIIQVTPEASSLSDFSQEDQNVIRRLEKIFWEELPQMKINRLIEEINPVGGIEKAKAIQQILRKTGSPLSDVIYIGDSITDVESLRMVREGGGIAVSFNGNAYAVREADTAIISSDTQIISLITEVFKQKGRVGILEFAEDWGKKIKVEHDAFIKLQNLYQKTLFGFHMVTEENMSEIILQSTSFRKKVRGEKIGGLG